ncbi:unnamed protein product [Linum tenue]|uniref:S-protein homolog n=1 Tax=Linum tenue TaxID=586396 RepID=A0AAV0IGS8_9ROSI|nr:unnamed protein product [Linum tenue]
MAARPSISKKASVSIGNRLPTSAVTARCQSKDNDIGRHDIAVGDSIAWSFGDVFTYETLFWCDLNATDYGILSFDAYRGNDAEFYDYHLHWFVEKDGVHVGNLIAIGGNLEEHGFSNPCLGLCSGFLVFDVQPPAGEITPGDSREADLVEESSEPAGSLLHKFEEEEMPERLIGVVRVCQMEMSSAAIGETATATMVGRGIGLAKVNDED